MNWYKTYRFAQAANQVSSIFNEALETVDQLVNSIYVTVNKTKKQPDMARYVANDNVAKLYIRFENAAKKIPELIKYRDVRSAKAMLSQALQYVKQLCAYMRTCNTPPFVAIDENLSNVNIILNDLESRASQPQVNVNVNTQQSQQPQETSPQSA